MSEEIKMKNCHNCGAPKEATVVGKFLLYGLSQFAKFPLFAFYMCQDCFDNLKASVEADAATASTPKIQVIQ